MQGGPPAHLMISTVSCLSCQAWFSHQHCVQGGILRWKRTSRMQTFPTAKNTHGRKTAPGDWSACSKSLARNIGLLSTRIHTQEMTREHSVGNTLNKAVTFLRTREPTLGQNLKTAVKAGNASAAKLHLFGFRESTLERGLVKKLIVGSPAAKTLALFHIRQSTRGRSHFSVLWPQSFFLLCQNSHRRKIYVGNIVHLQLQLPQYQRNHTRCGMFGRSVKVYCCDWCNGKLNGQQSFRGYRWAFWEERERRRRRNLGL